MPILSIRLTRKTDGTSVISCEREDGTTTWQRRRFEFFPLHDLTHYAVESQLGVRGGFFGLLMDGWQITDFGGRDLPADASDDAILTESIVGLLDQEMGAGIRLDAEEFNFALNAALDGLNIPARRALSADELAAIRETRLEVFGQWTNTEPGNSLDLKIRMD